MTTPAASPYPAPDADMPIYVISVAAELSGLHPQTLRQYDRLGLVSPGRSAGRSRRYSLRDIALLREVQRLSQEEGVNLAGIKRILELETELDSLREQIERVLAELAHATQAVAQYEAHLAVSYQRRYLPVPAAPPTTGALVVWRPAPRGARA